MRFPEFKGEWQKTVLRKICNIQRGGSPRPILNFISNSKDAVNWIKISDVDIDGHIWRTQEKIKPEGVKYSRKVYKGDLLLSNSMSFGVPYILEVDGCIHDGWLVIKPFSKEVNLKFLYQYLSCPWCLNQYKRLASGGVVNNLNKNLVSSIRLSLPENLEQDKISEFLALLDERISVQRKTIEDYKQTLRSLINHLTKDGVIFRFKNLYLKAKEGGTPDTKKNQYYINGTIPFVKIKDLDRKYLNKTESFINNDGLSNSSAWLIPSNSILLSNGATIGRVSINAIPVSTKQGILGIIPNKSVILTDYFYYLLKSSYFQKEIRRITTKGTMDAAYISDIDDIDLFVPDLNVQRKRAKVLSFVNQKINIEESKLNILNNLKTYLLANLFI